MAGLDYLSSSAGLGSVYSTSFADMHGTSFSSTARHPANNVVYIRVTPSETMPEMDVWHCAYCGELRTGMHCPGCGAARPDYP